MVFQDALSSLNPVFTVGNQIMESLMIHRKISKQEAKDRAIEMLGLVGIPDPQRRFYQYPFELSGWYETEGYDLQWHWPAAEGADRR